MKPTQVSADARCRLARRRASCVALGLWLVPAIALAQDPPRIVERIIHYDVTGHTAETLRAELARGIEREDIERPPSPAITESRIELRYRLERREDGCRIGELQVALDLTITLPQWRPAQAAEKGLSERWASLYDALVKHEAGHRRHAVEAAEALHSQLLGLPAAADCPRLERTIEAMHRKVISRLSMRDLFYDQSTGHGVAEGAVL